MEPENTTQPTRIVYDRSSGRIGSVVAPKMTVKTDAPGAAEALESPLLAAAGFSHAFFTRRGGVSAPPWDTLSFAIALGDDPAADRELYPPPAGGERADQDVRVHRAVEPDEPDAPAIWPAGGRLQLGDDLHRPHLRGAGHAASRECCPEQVERGQPGPQLAPHLAGIDDRLSGARATDEVEAGPPYAGGHVNTIEVLGPRAVLSCVGHHAAHLAKLVRHDVVEPLNDIAASAR